MNARKLQPWSHCLNHRCPRRGSVLPIFAISIVMLLGVSSLAVDYSVLLSDRNHLQRACDASALAGGAYLKRTGNDADDTAEAKKQALLMASLNKLAAGEITADSITFSNNNTRIQVTATRNRSLFFARVFGITDGKVSAKAVAGISGFSTPQVVPIAITPTSKTRYENSRLPQTLTLTRTKEDPFVPDYNRVPAFDPFQLFDLRGNQAKSPEKMGEQLSGQEVIPVDIGAKVTNMSASLGPQSNNFKEGISAAFTRAAGAPWNDPVAKNETEPWKMVGMRLPEILGGTHAANNPRIMNLVVVEETPTPPTNYDYTIQNLAPVYVHSVTETALGLQLTVTFLGPTSSYVARPVSLLD